MSSAASVTSATRSALGVMVEREERRVGSRDVAYEIVAQTVGASSSWVRKFLHGYNEAKEPRITLFLNIRTAYDRICQRVEMEHANELMKIEALKGELNAATAGFDQVAASETGAEGAGAKGEAVK